jgi:hypothetical protein
MILGPSKMQEKQYVCEPSLTEQKKLNISLNSSIQLKDNIKLHSWCHSLDSWTISSFSIYIMYIIILFHCIHISHNLHDVYMWIQKGSVLHLYKNETFLNLHYRTEIDALKLYSLSKSYSNSENSKEGKKTSFHTNFVLRKIQKFSRNEIKYITTYCSKVASETY